MNNVFLTGVAGFIGFHLAELLLSRGYNVTGVDSLSDYYDQALKLNRLKNLEKHPNFKFYKLDISDKDKLYEVYAASGIDVTINLAAQAGVRYSTKYPQQYIDSNIQGFLNVLEACRNYGVRHLIFASSSSVYGANTKQPFSVDDCADHPLSLYAATKKANELMAHSYAAMYNIPVTGLRFFTVYGPWGRPDMSYFLFTEKIIKQEAIELYNYGDMKRDFTYIDDIVNAVAALIDKPPVPQPERIGKPLKTSESYAPYRLFNIGSHHPVKLTEFLSIIEEEVGRKAIVENKPLQPGDMLETFADVNDLVQTIGVGPQTDIRTGLKRFVKWYKDYYGID